MSELAGIMDQAVKAMGEKEGKYLTFTLNNEEYGIGILKIREIIGMMPFTTIPQTPEFLKGVINLRGKWIPVIDLRLKFGMETMAYTDRTSIVVVEVERQSGIVVIGIVVDAVSEVLDIKGGASEEIPALNTKLDRDYIHGLARMEGGVKILLDIDGVVNR